MIWPKPELQEAAERFWARFTDPEADFEGLALEAFRLQAQENPVYRAYLNALGVRPNLITSWRQIPPLPVEAFRHAPVCIGPPERAQAVFQSSGTTASGRSRHYVQDLRFYDRSALTHFAQAVGSGPLVLAAWLPGYAERPDASLLYMVRRLIEAFGRQGSGFAYPSLDRLRGAIEEADRSGSLFVLFGAAFGLLELLETHGPVPLPPKSLVIETGGMKGRRRELERGELHELLARGFGLARQQVLSEYGMTELLSQAYSRGGEVFYPPSWMRFRVVSPEDPLGPELPEGEPGALVLVDLANYWSVCAIQTQDLAVRRAEGFEVIGRLEGAPLRGCNLLLERDL
ncbi:MAG: acyl transferase [Bacteroidetes bacterium]|nr:acyl transferase [Rhodothermia bacterium]MCS7155550.1 acyl transferase [Bacteroidota bacterium]MCX7906408.1 acyl transferase [Bacteroidota bacterium]MDW8137310.1 acyl transferase [Bacteroidota bacterium]MDW8284820.1 acyl transferase [Bacteroidota bacterium]